MCAIAAWGRCGLFFKRRRQGGQIVEGSDHAHPSFAHLFALCLHWSVLFLCRASGVVDASQRHRNGHARQESQKTLLVFLLHGFGRVPQTTHPKMTHLQDKLPNHLVHAIFNCSDLDSFGNPAMGVKRQFASCPAANGCF